MRGSMRMSVFRRAIKKTCKFLTLESAVVTVSMGNLWRVYSAAERTKRISRSRKHSLNGSKTVDCSSTNTCVNPRWGRQFPPSSSAAQKRDLCKRRTRKNLSRWTKCPFENFSTLRVIGIERS